MQFIWTTNPLSVRTQCGSPGFDPRRGMLFSKALSFYLLSLLGVGLQIQEVRCIMHHKIVHAGKRTLFTWWKSMIEVAVLSTAAPALLHNALHWAQASSGWGVGLMTRRHRCGHWRITADSHYYYTWFQCAVTARQSILNIKSRQIQWYTTVTYPQLWYLQWFCQWIICIRLLIINICFCVTLTQGFIFFNCNKLTTSLMPKISKLLFSIM